MNQVAASNEGRVLLIDKPYGWTSFDVVKKLRFGLKVKKIGHAGTLDPLATGLLVLCTGKMTKQIEKFQGWEKEYVAEIHLGQTTPSYDLETEPTEQIDVANLSSDAISEAVDSFLGLQNQIPPIFSAIKVKGKRAYEAARKGEDIKLKSRQIEIKKLEVLDVTLPKIVVKVVCSKGTYIRSLAHDIGKKIGVGAHLSGLRRTRIGELSVSDAVEPLVFLKKEKGLTE